MFIIITTTMPATRINGRDRSAPTPSPYLVHRIRTTEPSLIPIRSPSSSAPKLGVPDYEYTAFGMSPEKDRAAIQMLIDRAIRRFNRSQERTVYIFVWPQVCRPLLVALSLC